MYILSRSLCLAAVFLLTFVRSCNPDVSQTNLPNQLRDFYLKNNWIPLGEPDSRFQPGSIVRITQAEGITYVSDLKTCGVPDDILKPVTGEAPQLKFDRDGDYGAKAVLNVKGVTAGPDFSRISSTSLAYEKHGSDSLDILKIAIWLSKPENAATLPKPCTDFLNAPDNYIVREAYEVSKGKYTLKGSNKASLTIKNLALGPVTIAPDAHANLTTTGELTFTDPVYTAIKRLKDTNGLLTILGQPGQVDADADAKVKTILFPASK